MGYKEKWDIGKSTPQLTILPGADPGIGQIQEFKKWGGGGHFIGQFALETKSSQKKGGGGGGGWLDLPLLASYIAD